LKLSRSRATNARRSSQPQRGDEVRGGVRQGGERVAAAPDRPPRAIAVNTNTLIDHTRTGSVGARIAKVRGDREQRPRSPQGFGAHGDSRQNSSIILILLDQ